MLSSNHRNEHHVLRVVLDKYLLDWFATQSTQLQMFASKASARHNALSTC